MYCGSNLCCVLGKHIREHVTAYKTKHLEIVVVARGLLVG